MEVIKLIGIAFVTLIFAIILREYKKDFVIYVVLTGGLAMIFYSMNTFEGIINFISNISDKTNINNDFIKLLIKVTCISIFLEFGISICKDSGETAIANKLDFGGRIIVISMSIPVISGLLNGLLELLP